MSLFNNLPQVKYEGPKSENPLAFKYYDAERVIAGKKMKDHLKFAMAWWHNLCASGTDMFGSGTADKTFGAEPGTMAHAKAKVDAGFEFMQKLGIEYFCFLAVPGKANRFTDEERAKGLTDIYDLKNSFERLWEMADQIMTRLSRIK